MYTINKFKSSSYGNHRMTYSHPMISEFTILADIFEV